MTSTCFQLLRADSYQRQPWKNAKGETLEIARADGSPCQWRISMATLSSDGPFSLFPGYERTLILLDGGPITLVHSNQAEVELHRFGIHTFSGDLETSMKITAPGNDLNIFTLRNEVRAAVSLFFLENAEEQALELHSKIHYFFCINGRAKIAMVNNKEAQIITAGDSLRINGGGHVTCRAATVEGIPATRIASISIELHAPS